MSNTHYALDFLDQSELSCAPVCVVFGDEPFLKQLVIKKLQHQILGDESEVPFAVFDGKSAEWRDVIDELSTVSLADESQRNLGFSGRDCLGGFARSEQDQNS